jgi:hypothetical protein
VVELVEVLQKILVVLVVAVMLKVVMEALTLVVVEAEELKEDLGMVTHKAAVMVDLVA